MFVEYITYYTVCVFFIVLSILVLIPFALLFLRLLSISANGFFGILISIVCAIMVPYGIYKTIERNVEPYRVSMMRDYMPMMYKKEICPETRFPYSIDSSITYDVYVCYPIETNMRKKAEAWYNKNRSDIMMQCLEKANPQYKFRCDSATKEYFNGMLEVDLKRTNIEQMIESGAKKFKFQAATAREGVY